MTFSLTAARRARGIPKSVRPLIFCDHVAFPTKTCVKGRLWGGFSLAAPGGREGDPVTWHCDVKLLIMMYYREPNSDKLRISLDKLIYNNWISYADQSIQQTIWIMSRDRNGNENQFSAFGWFCRPISARSLHILQYHLYTIFTFFVYLVGVVSWCGTSSLDIL